MSTLSYEFVEHPTNQQIEEALSICVDLMKNDPVVTCFTEGNKSLIPLQIRSDMMASLVSGGQFYAAFTAERKIVGFLLLLPPGIDTSPEGKKISQEYKDKLSPEGQEFLKNAMITFFTLVSSILGPTGMRDVWWCHLAMTRSDFQRQGVATHLFQLVKDKATPSGQEIALTAANDVNIPVYQGLGFTLRASVIIQAPQLESEFPIHLFWIGAGNSDRG